MPTISALQMIGGARRAKNVIRTTLYVMLMIPPAYQPDLKFLIKEFKYRHYQVEEHFNYQKPDIHHMTLLKVDLILTPHIVNKIVKGTRLAKETSRTNFFRYLKHNHKRDTELWDDFKEHLEIQLEQQISRDLAKLFRGLPPDTTASCYHSRYNLFGDFAVIQYKPDLGFFKIILPQVKRSVNRFFGNAPTSRNTHKVKAGEYYDDPRNILLHISFAKLDTPRYRVKQSLLNRIKSNHRDNFLGPEEAKNFVIHRNHLLKNDAIMVSAGRPQFY